MEVRLMKKITR